MQQPEFAPVAREAVQYYAAGEDGEQWQPGDFLLTHGDAMTSKLIRLGQRLRIHGADRKYTWFNHAALVLDEKGNIAEALGRGVVTGHASKYTERTYARVRPVLAAGDVDQITAFAGWVLETRHRYGYLTIASIGLSLLTGAKFTFFIDGEFICSGFVARAMERTGAVFSRDPVHVMPADLAKYYDVAPPA